MPQQTNEWSIKPWPGKIAVALVDPGSEYKHIIIPASARKQPTQGRVVAVFDPWIDETGAEIKPLCAPGDIVIFGEYQGTEIVIGDSRTKVVILREQDILVTLLPEGQHEPDSKGAAPA